jgi:hypothetical protein
MILYTFWLPIIEFKKFKKNLLQNGFVITNNNETEKYYYFQYSNATIIIDTLGFFYIENSSAKSIKAIFKIIADSLNQETKDLINLTFLNEHISCDLEKKSYTEFIESIYFKTTLDTFSLDEIFYQLQNDFHNKNFKFTSDENSSLANIINRNFIQLLEKSLFFTHGLEYEKGEIYNLALFNAIDIKKIISKISLDVYLNNKKQKQQNQKILESIIKKAIQDSIEEKTLLRFLKSTKTLYLKNIFEKLNKVNESIEKLHSQILALEYSSKDDSKCPIKSEEEIEIFIQHILQTIPKFKTIDNKIKNAYYLKIGNVTTSTHISNNETIEHALFYQKWKSSIEYFENMANEIKEILVIYHQNKSYKELENINYYENYKSDLEDIRNLNSALPEKEKKYLEFLIFIITLTALTGEAPIFEFSHINPSNNNLPFWSQVLINIADLLVNITFYAIVLTVLYFNKETIRKVFASLIDKFIIFWNNIPYIKKKKAKRIEYFLFDEFDYDKHEHRSTKPIYIYNKQIKENEVLTISYNEIDSAYELMKALKEITITKANQKSYSLFPEILKKPYKKKEKSYSVFENYRISRTDKVNSKILFRYKITDFKLIDFVKEIKKDKEFLDYYQTIATEFNIEKLLRTLPNDKEIQLNLYIVYSFNLKFKEHKNSIYYYNVLKDQFRVHYHINKLPKNNNIEENLRIIAKLVYIYFLARVKNFDYLNKSFNKKKEA